VSTVTDSDACTASVRAAFWVLLAAGAVPGVRPTEAISKLIVHTSLDATGSYLTGTHVPV
jgi:hypothetical protein